MQSNRKNYELIYVGEFSELQEQTEGEDAGSNL